MAANLQKTLVNSENSEPGEESRAPARRQSCGQTVSAETIFAPASGAGVAGIAVIRISGPRADKVLAALTDQPLPPPRQATLRRLHDADGDPLDEALVLRFAAGGSYTGEPVVELHCHGGRAVVAAVLRTLADLPGCRLAEPGEFTPRALEHGRLDVPAVEALGDLLTAETERQRRQALVALGGALQRQAEHWRATLLQALALIEATLDWADEEVPPDVGPEVAAHLSDVCTGIRRELALSEGARQLREGFEVAILGAPNVGKSTLFNVLAGREAAIVSPVSGTTRDVLELRYDLGGLPVIFLDTAGLRAGGDAIEAEGIARAAGRARAAALRLFLHSADAAPPGMEDELRRPGDLRVWTKSDLGAGPGDVAISARTGEGMEALLGRIEEELAGRIAEPGLAGHLRQQRVLEEAAGALERAEAALGEGHTELCAEDLRAAFRALERLLGRVGVEEVLDEVFARFCLGK